MFFLHFNSNNGKLNFDPHFENADFFCCSLNVLSKNYESKHSLYYFFFVPICILFLLSIHKYNYLLVMIWSLITFFLNRKGSNIF